MENKINMEKKIENFRQVCINRYNALYLENDYRKGNNLERRLVAQAQELIISQEGVRALLKMLQDENEIVRLIEEVIAQNPTLRDDYKAGKTRAQGFVMGQIMKKTGGKVNPGVANKLIIKELLK